MQTRNVVLQCACAALKPYIYATFVVLLLLFVFFFLFFPVTFTKKGVPMYFVVSLCGKYLSRDSHGFCV